MAGSEKKLSLLQIASSTVAAMFGVQSQANRERDFRVGKPIHFVVAGVVGTIVFVLVIVAVVRLVLSAAGA